MSGKRLYRSNNRRIAGVAGGVAEYLNLNPTQVRIGFVVLGLLFQTFTPIYLILWKILPSR